MKRFFKHILNPDIELRRRLFQLLSTIAMAEFLVVTVYTIVSDKSISHILLMVAGTILFGVTVTITFRSGRIRLGTAVAAMLYYALYPLTFFSSGGMYGGAPAVWVFALVYVFLITEKWERILCIAVCVIGYGVCYLISYLHPETLSRHTVLMEHVESFLSILLVVLLLCALFAFVTEVYRAEKRIVQKQKKEIEDLNQAQKRFFSSMSHEIRTPVNAIIGLNEMILREELSDEARENAEHIEVASRTLLQTINEIMDISRLETGRMEIVRSDYRTTAMLSEIESLVRLRAREKGLEFLIKVNPDLPSVLYGDEVRIKQILLNVITNAIKYTKTGSVTVTVGYVKEADLFRIVYDITDTGIGIREENIPHLFDAFQRVDEQNTYRIEGTGLGLSIVKQLLDLMDGSVSVRSEYGKGSTFLIEIPQEVIDETPVGEGNFQKKERRASEKKPGIFEDSPLRILAVDDTPMNLMVVKKLLRDSGAVVETAASGEEALLRTEQEYYDLILMDHQMPEMDGIECLHRIREQETGKCRESRIVCLTANAGPEMEKFYRKEGFDGYLEKPVRGNLLEAEILQTISKRFDT